MSNSFDHCGTPLAGFPSVLAVRDLRRQARKCLSDRADRAEITRLLEIDPLTLLRCLRVFHAPVYGVRPQVLGIPRLVDRLGVAFVKNAFCTPSIPPGRTGGVRALWLHSIATAVAARGLAQQTGALNPDQAYVLGLLHDLGEWSTELALWRNLSEQPISADEWIARWNLPLALRLKRDADPVAFELVRRAEELANLAGFREPRAGDGPTLLDGGQRVASMQDFVRGKRLHAEVVEVLKKWSLEPNTEPPTGDAERATPDDDALFTNKTVGRTTDLVLSLALCQRSEHARGLVTATTSAALRYLGFDRAYAIRWIRGLDRCWIRQKADLTPRGILSTQVQLTPEERQLFEAALATGDGQFLVPGDQGEGLLTILGSDAALIVPVNPSFHVPTLMLLDRAVSGAPLDPRRDRSQAKALASVSSLLQENLLLKRQRARVTKFALTDPLTRLANRGVGIVTLRQEIARSNRAGEPLAVLMMDLDKFKALNDQFGHLVGDQALRTAAEVLRKNTRKMDTVCRYGGEEFVVILPGTQLEDASVTATRIQAAIEVAGDELGLPLTVSIGVAAYKRGEDNVESLLSRADRALYASKERGRNRFSVDCEEVVRK